MICRRVSSARSAIPVPFRLGIPPDSGRDDFTATHSGAQACDFATSRRPWTAQRRRQTVIPLPLTTRQVPSWATGRDTVRSWATGGGRRARLADAGRRPQFVEPAQVETAPGHRRRGPCHRPQERTGEPDHAICPERPCRCSPSASCSPPAPARAERRPPRSAAAPTAAPSEAAPSAAAGGITVNLADSTLGKVLADGSRQDPVRVHARTARGKSACNGDCATNWPPLLSDAAPTPGDGLDAEDFTIIARDDGTKQVAFYGHPLYYFAGDKAAGDTNGQGVGGKWFVVGADGNMIGAAAASPSAAASAAAGVQRRARRQRAGQHPRRRRRHDAVRVHRRQRRQVRLQRRLRRELAAAPV